MEQALEAELARPGPWRAGLRGRHPGHQLLAPALCPGDVGGHRAAVGRVSRPWRGGIRPGGRRGGPAARRAPGGVRHRGATAVSASRSTPGEAAGAGSIAGGGAPLPRRPHRPRHPAVRGSRSCATTFETAGCRSRSTSPATSRPGPWPGPRTTRCAQYVDAGLAVTLCTDGWLMTGVTLTDEYWLAHTELGFTRAEIDRCILGRLRERVPSLARAAGARGAGADELAALR